MSTFQIAIQGLNYFNLCQHFPGQKPHRTTQELLQIGILDVSTVGMMKKHVQVCKHEQSCVSQTQRQGQILSQLHLLVHILSSFKIVHVVPVIQKYNNYREDFLWLSCSLSTLSNCYFYVSVDKNKKGLKADTFESIKENGIDLIFIRNCFYYISSQVTFKDSHTTAPW